MSYIIPQSRFVIPTNSNGKFSPIFHFGFSFFFWKDFASLHHWGTNPMLKINEGKFFCEKMKFSSFFKILTSLHPIMLQTGKDEKKAKVRTKPLNEEQQRKLEEIFGKLEASSESVLSLTLSELILLCRSKGITSGKKGATLCGWTTKNKGELIEELLSKTKESKNNVDHVYCSKTDKVEFEHVRDEDDLRGENGESEDIEEEEEEGRGSNTYELDNSENANNSQEKEINQNLRIRLKIAKKDVDQMKDAKKKCRRRKQLKEEEKRTLENIESKMERVGLEGLVLKELKLLARSEGVNCASRRKSEIIENLREQLFLSPQTMEQIENMKNERQARRRNKRLIEGQYDEDELDYEVMDEDSEGDVRRKRIRESEYSGDIEEQYQEREEMYILDNTKIFNERYHGFLLVPYLTLDNAMEVAPIEKFENFSAVPPKKARHFHSY